jgi:D-amino peptidase
MRVYISVDMEGIAGVSHPRPTARTDSEYAAAVGLMVGEANAAIEGARAAGATDILVNDSHGGMYNLPPADLDPAARLLQGQKAWSMVAGAAPDGADAPARFDVALFVGYHARAGHPMGTIAHTYTGGPTETRLNGRPTGEYGFNALVLGAWGIPVGLVAGDDALADEVAGWLPWAERVVVKEGAGSNAAASFHPEAARGLIREAAARAVGRAGRNELRLLEPAPPVVIEVDYRRGIEADLAALVPLGERVGDRTARHPGPDAITAYRGFLTGVRLATLAD